MTAMRSLRTPLDAHRRGSRALHGAISALALLASASTLGCAVGFQSARLPPRDAPPGAAPRLGWNRVTIVAPHRGILVPGLERVLAERGVQEISYAMARPSTYVGTIVEVHERSEAPPLYVASGLVSLFTMSVVPGYVAADRHVTFTLHRPGAAARPFQYRFTERAVIWLPLLLFGPDFFVGVNGGWQREKEWTAVADEIARRFVDDASDRCEPTRDQLRSRTSGATR